MPTMSNGNILAEMARFAGERRKGQESAAPSHLHGPYCGYIRVSGKGFRPVSVDREFPLCRFTTGPVRRFETARDHALSCRPFPLADQKGMSRGERCMQAHLIREASKVGGDLRGILGELPFDPFTFAFDEVRLYRNGDSSGPTIRCDVLAIGGVDGRFEPVVIELKYARSDELMNELVQQLDEFGQMIHAHQPLFEDALEKATGRTVDAGRVHRVIVWPATDTQADRDLVARLRSLGVCSVGCRAIPARDALIEIQEFEVETAHSEPRRRGR